MQLTIPLASQSKLFPMNVLRKADSLFSILVIARYWDVLSGFGRLRRLSTCHFSFFGPVVFITPAHRLCFFFPFCSAKVKGLAV